MAVKAKIKTTINSPFLPRTQNRKEVCIQVEKCVPNCLSLKSRGKQMN